MNFENWDPNRSVKSNCYNCCIFEPNLGRTVHSRFIQPFFYWCVSNGEAKQTPPPPDDRIVYVFSSYKHLYINKLLYRLLLELFHLDFKDLFLCVLWVRCIGKWALNSIYFLVLWSDGSIFCSAIFYVIKIIMKISRLLLNPYGIYWARKFGKFNRQILWRSF